MATQHRIDPRSGRAGGPVVGSHDEPQMRTLLKQLASEGSELLRNEMALAKLEMRDMAREVVLDSVKLAAAVGLVLTGAFALLTAAIIGLGHLLDGRFGLSALIIGTVVIVAGALLARGGVAGLRNVPKPRETMRSLREDRQWADRELRQFKEEIRS